MNKVYFDKHNGIACSVDVPAGWYKAPHWGRIYIVLVPGLVLTYLCQGHILEVDSKVAEIG